MAMAVYKHSHWGLRLALATCCMSLVLLSKNSTRRGRARLPLLLFRLPLVSLMIFICSDVYAQGDHWSGMSQRGSIWKAVRILLSFVAIFESLLLDFTTESQQRLVNISLEMLAILVGLGVITLDALSVRFGQDVGKMWLRPGAGVPPDLLQVYRREVARQARLATLRIRKRTSEEADVVKAM